MNSKTNYIIKTAHSFVQGLGHIEKNIPCQDRTLSYTDKEIGVISLSDGAGSCKHSDIGAAIVTNVIVNLFQTNHSKIFEADNLDKLQKYFISNILIDLDKKAKETSAKLKDFSATLLFVAIKDQDYIAGHIGDGLIGTSDKNGELTVLSVPVNTEYANTTYFVTDSDSFLNIRLYKGDLSNINGFIIMSDGVTSSMYDKRTNEISSVVKQMFSWLDEVDEKEVCSILQNNIENILLKKTNDDCSIALMRVNDLKTEELPILRIDKYSAWDKFVRWVRGVWNKVWRNRKQ